MPIGICSRAVPAKFAPRLRPRRKSGPVMRCAVRCASDGRGLLPPLLHNPHYIVAGEHLRAGFSPGLPGLFVCTEGFTSSGAAPANVEGVSPFFTLRIFLQLGCQHYLIIDPIII